MQTNIPITSQNINNFMSPEAMLEGLIAALANPCGCGSEDVECECMEQQLNQEIKGLQSESNNIRSEIVQVQQLLQARDHLYTELDQLRQQRDQIENQIDGCATYEHTQTVHCSGSRQMNERLKRRIYQVRQYIQKMTYQNQKIQESIISHQYFQQEEQFAYRKQQLHPPSPVYEGKRRNTSNVETLIEKIHGKQEQAWKRVKRQEEQIQRRNNDARMRKSGMSGVRTYYSPKARTYYSPSRQIY